MKKLGFTLAEVLITLVIIGVIAAMTVPTLMNNTQGTENKTAFKKAISSLNQALTLEYALEGNTAASTELSEIMRRRTNVINTEAAWPGGTLPTGTDAAAATITTADGLIYSIPSTAGTADDPASCPGEPTATQDIYDLDDCGIGAVDVNGVKGPNVAVTDPAKPQDQFRFKIFETKVIPGTSADDPEAWVMYDKKTENTTTGQ